MKQYKDLVEHILKNGEVRADRTGVGTKSVFGYQCRFDLSEGFPMVTLKKTNLKAVVAELLWFIEGSTDERRLAELTFSKPRSEITDKKTIWTENADAQGVSLGYENNDMAKELGPVYGAQWRGNSNGFDQLKWLIEEIKNNPDSRRLILSAWNVNDLSKMALPPCHTMFQFYVMNGKLSCQLYQRSADIGIGIPFNIASYALLTEMIAKVCGLKPGDFVHTIGDAHIYTNHIEKLSAILEREPLKLPTLNIEQKLIEEFVDVVYNGGKFSLDAQNWVSLENYNHHPFIPLPMAV